MPQLSEMKQAVRETWAAGDYDAFLRKENFYQLGERLVRHAGVDARQRVLDLACGSGNVAIPAAATGARVTGADLTPELLAVARQRATQAGVEVEWVEGDAEQLRFADGSFDVVLSSFGCMFAPRHQLVADEIGRVLRAGGRIGIYAWVTDGPIADFFGLVAEYLPPLPEYASPPLLWGQPDHVRQLFEGTGVVPQFTRERFDIRYPSVTDAVNTYTTLFGPVVQALAAAEADGRGPQLRKELAAMFARHNAAGSGELVFPAEYLAISGKKEPPGAG